MEDVRWNIVFGATLDRIWWRRNDFVFRNKWTNEVGVLLSVKALVMDINQRKRIGCIL